MAWMASRVYQGASDYLSYLPLSFLLIDEVHQGSAGGHTHQIGRAVKSKGLIATWRGCAFMKEAVIFAKS